MSPVTSRTLKYSFVCERSTALASNPRSTPVSPNSSFNESGLRLASQLRKPAGEVLWLWRTRM